MVYVRIEKCSRGPSIPPFSVRFNKQSISFSREFAGLLNKPYTEMWEDRDKDLIKFTPTINEGNWSLINNTTFSKHMVTPKALNIQRGTYKAAEENGSIVVKVVFL